MTKWQPLGWALGALSIASTVAGAYLTGTTGDVHVLLLTGLGAATVWLALWEELQASGEARPEAARKQSEAESEGSP